MKIAKTAGVAETQQSDIEEIKKRKSDSFQSKFNQAASHVVSQIEYGSSVFIELVHTGIATLESQEIFQEFIKYSSKHPFYLEEMTESQRHISGDVKISVELIAGMIEGEGGVDWQDSQKKVAKQTTFIIHGTLKQTVFATSFESLNEIIQEIKLNPDAYLAEVPQDLCSRKKHLDILLISILNILGTSWSISCEQ